MPHKFGLLAEVLAHCEPSIVVAIAAGKDDNTKSHEMA